MIIYCTRELEWVIVCDEDKSMICTDKFLNVSKTYTWTVTSCWEEGKFLSCLIQIVQELLYEISVFGDVPDLYPLYFHCMINYCSTFISFWQKILNLTVVGFLALDGFQFLFFFFQMLTRKKNVSRDTMILRCFHHGQNLVTKCATSVSLMRTGEVNNTLNSEIAREWVNTLSILFNKCKAKISGLL